ncbi:MAG TPA: TolC family protein [Candidatus Avirikenella pullistercoris]|nr:TolC family protein [Candidatus Avirikenella pullistercoris]
MKKRQRILSAFLLLSIPFPVQAQDTLHYKLNIETMFELAESNSKSIRTFDLAEQEAEQAVKVAKNAMLPTLDLSLSASYLGDGWLADRNFSNGTTAPMPHFGNNFAIEASQIVYAGGAVSNSISVAELHRQSAYLDKENNRQEIRFLLTGNYLELYKLHNQSAVYRKNIEQTERLLADIKAKQAEGVALKNDITRYELQLQSLELALTQLENSRLIINNRLVTVLGLPLETVIEVDTTLLDRLPEPLSEAYWQETGTNTSPILKQAELGVEQSRYNEKIVKAERLPSIALFAGNYLNGPITIEVPPINKNFNYWLVGVKVKFNIASAYTSGKKSGLAKLSTQKAVVREQLMRDNLQTEVKAAYIRFVESFTTYETQIKSLELATQNYNVVNNRYLNELALITDMLDASNSKLSAELNVANARVNILFNYYNLKKTIGNL